MNIQFCLRGDAYAILYAELNTLSRGVQAAVAAAVQLSHQVEQADVAYTYEFDCSDVVGNEIRKLFEQLEGRYQQQGDSAKSRACSIAAVDIGREIANGAQVSKLS